MFGRKIKYYRLKKGKTAEALAAAIGCTKAAISLYESDEREPSEETIKSIANALGIPWTDLYSHTETQPSFNHASFRKKQKASKKNIELLKMEIEERIANNLSLFDVLGLDARSVLEIKKLSFEDKAEHNAALIRSALGLPPNGPIYSLTNVLEHAGVLVLSFGCSDEIDGVNGSANGIPYIFFNSINRSIERQRFTIAHEVCHLFFDETCEGKTDKDIEKYINQVAGCLLIPDGDIYSIFGKTNRSITPFLRDNVAKEYKVAPSCLINRLLETEVITKIYHKNYFILLNKNGGRRFEKSLLDADRDSEQPTIFTQQVYLALSSELISASKAAEFLNIPLYDVIQNMRME